MSTEPIGSAGLLPGYRAIVTDDLNLRGGPGAEQPLVGTLTAGTAVDLLGSAANGRWWRVASADGAGHVNAAYLEPTGAPSDPAIFEMRK